MIECRNLTVAFQNKTILDRINLDVADGAFLCLLGQSGCGKSTLLRTFAGLLKPTSGEVSVDGKTVDGPENACSVVFQDYSLFPWMTTGKNLMLALSASYPQKSKAEIRNLAESYLEMVGLGGVFNQYPAALSGGMRQRAAIARAIAVPSRILLMDEPFGALDAITRARQQDMLLEIWQAGGSLKKTVLFVTHDVDEALILAGRVIVLGVCPGHVAADIPVDLPRPRSRGNSIASRQFRELRERLLQELDSAVARQLEASQELQEGGGI